MTNKTNKITSATEVKRSKASNKKKSIPDIIEIWSVNDLTQVDKMKTNNKCMGCIYQKEDGKCNLNRCFLDQVDKMSNRQNCTKHLNSSTDKQIGSDKK